jgi:hypothetical protein
MHILILRKAHDSLLRYQRRAHAIEFDIRRPGLMGCQGWSRSSIQFDQLTGNQRELITITWHILCRRVEAAARRCVFKIWYKEAQWKWCCDGVWLWIHRCTVTSCLTGVHLLTQQSICPMSAQTNIYRTNVGLRFGSWTMVVHHPPAKLIACVWETEGLHNLISEIHICGVACHRQAVNPRSP